MNEQTSETVLIHVPFVFEACVLERRKRKPRHKVYRSAAPVELERIRSAEVAYTIELGSNETVDVLIHQGRLLWPMNYTDPLWCTVGGDALGSLQEGGGGHLQR